MTPGTEREIVQFTVHLNTTPPGRFSDLDELAHQIWHDAKAGLCVSPIDNGRLQIGLSDAAIVDLKGGTKGLAMLFDLIDPEASVPANRHMKTRKLRTFDKEQDEGRAVSAHLLLELAPIDDSNRFRALLEVSLGLGQSRVKPHLQRIIRRIFQERDFRVEDADGNLVPATPTFGMHAVRSDKLRQDIENAEISELVLIQASVPKGDFDPPEVIDVSRREMRLKVEKSMVGEVAKVLNAIKPWAKEQGYDQVYVRWKRCADESDLEGKSKSAYDRAKIDLRNQDIGETLFAKRHFVSLDSEMNDCVETLRDDVLEAMIGLI